MKLLVFGKSGQVATELRRQANVVALSRADADLTDPAACAAIIAKTNADAIINAAAYTGVDAAEADEATAHTVNAEAPGTMAEAAAKRDLPFLHISTDYVFDGSGTEPWAVDAPTAPLGTYGRTKRAGEKAVRNAGGRHAILRTSWVFSAHGNNFVKTMLRLGKERDALTIVADQIGGPTAAADIAYALRQMAEAFHSGHGKTGTYHFAGAPDASWADFAREIFAQAGISTAVTDIPTTQFPTPAERPKNSRLDCTTTEIAFGLKRPDWRQSLGAVLKELGEVA